MVGVAESVSGITSLIATLKHIDMHVASTKVEWDLTMLQVHSACVILPLGAIKVFKNVFSTLRFTKQFSPWLVSMLY